MESVQSSIPATSTQSETSHEGPKKKKNRNNHKRAKKQREEQARLELAASSTQGNEAPQEGEGSSIVASTNLGVSDALSDTFVLSASPVGSSGSSTADLNRTDTVSPDAENTQPDIENLSFMPCCHSSRNTSAAVTGGSTTAVIETDALQSLENTLQQLLDATKITRTDFKKEINAYRTEIVNALQTTMDFTKRVVAVENTLKTLEGSSIKKQNQLMTTELMKKLDGINTKVDDSIKEHTDCIRTMKDGAQAVSKVFKGMVKIKEHADIKAASMSQIKDDTDQKMTKMAEVKEHTDQKLTKMVEIKEHTDQKLTKMAEIMEDTERKLDLINESGRLSATYLAQMEAISARVEQASAINSDFSRRIIKLEKREQWTRPFSIVGFLTVIYLIIQCLLYATASITSAWGGKDDGHKASNTGALTLSSGPSFSIVTSSMTAEAAIASIATETSKTSAIRSATNTLFEAAGTFTSKVSKVAPPCEVVNGTLASQKQYNATALGEYDISCYYREHERLSELLDNNIFSPTFSTHRTCHITNAPQPMVAHDYLKASNTALSRNRYAELARKHPNVVKGAIGVFCAGWGVWVGWRSYLLYGAFEDAVMRLVYQ
ncbi:hypothetical protein B0O99DRAFT_592878 [Bisporella sp. PMI_857]|nr:hypothetical protein B0O99DRAFT_592878 [Bisporella sp. PMI_857]